VVWHLKGSTAERLNRAAHSRGGDNSFENMVITCAPCNYARMEFTLEELGLLDLASANQCARTGMA